jgi:hypothetical protein
MRIIVAASFVWLGSLAAPAAQAQDAPDRGWVDVDAGWASAADDAFTMSATTTLFSEPADFHARYTAPRGFVVDIGGGVMVTPLLGAGVSVSAAQHEEVAVMSIRIPHPFFGSQFATGEAETDVKLQRAERAVHLQAIVVAGGTDRVRVRVFGGPSRYTLGQDAVTSIQYRQTSSIVPPSNNVEIHRFTQARVDASAWGFHAGADVSVFVLRNLGVGGFVKYGRATVALENTLATSVGASETIDVRAGGLRVGAGVRIRF